MTRMRHFVTTPVAWHKTTYACAQTFSCRKIINEFYREARMFAFLPKFSRHPLYPLKDNIARTATVALFCNFYYEELLKSLDSESHSVQKTHRAQVSFVT